MSRSASIWRTAFFVYVAITFLHIAYVVNHEPFSFDAWNVAHDTHAQSPSIGRFFAFWHQQYTSSNPRIGQPLAYLAYKTTGVAEILTPLAFLAIVFGGFVLGTRRMPDFNSSRDRATLAIAIGFLWFAAPNMPAYMFCRAYATNYIWLAAIQIWFLVPLRLYDASRTDPVKIAACVGYFLLGVVAGMGNEHVGPTLIVFTIGYLAWLWRARQQRPIMLWLGAIGLVVGYALIFFAPGQSQRYEGLAERYTLVQQILVRGFKGNMDIVQDLLEAAGPLLLLLIAILAVGMVSERVHTEELEEARERQARALRFVIITVLAASLITVTVFASPKMGPRFYMHSMFLLLAGVMGVIDAFLRQRRSFVPFLILAVVASSYAAARTIPMYTRVANASDQRLAELAAAPPGTDVTTNAWEQVVETWWTLGDDMRDQMKQEMVAKYFGLHRVLYRGADPWKVLGVTDVKVTLDYELDNPVCLDEVEALDIKPYIGRDIRALHHAFLDTVSDIKIATGQKPRAIDFKVTFMGTTPPLPPGKLYLGRWRDGTLTGYSARLRRTGRSTSRRIEPDPKLPGVWNIYLVAVGDQPKLLGTNKTPEKLTYVPWRTGDYWTIACQADACFVVLAVTHTI